MLGFEIELSWTFRFCLEPEVFIDWGSSWVLELIPGICSLLYSCLGLDPFGRIGACSYEMAVRVAKWN